MEDLSGRASELARKLAFVGFALIALFGGIKESKLQFPIHLPNRLVEAGLLLTLALAIDLLQYLASTLVYYAWAKWHEWQRDHHEGWVEPRLFPNWLEVPAWLCWYAKITALVWGWVLLLQHILSALD